MVCNGRVPQYGSSGGADAYIRQGVCPCPENARATGIECPRCGQRSKQLVSFRLSSCLFFAFQRYVRIVFLDGNDRLVMDL